MWTAEDKELLPCINLQETTFQSRPLQSSEEVRVCHEAGDELAINLQMVYSGRAREISVDIAVE